MSRFTIASFLFVIAAFASGGQGGELAEAVRVSVKGQVIDERAAGVGGVDIRGIVYDQTVVDRTDEDGSFTLEIDRERVASLTIVADDSVGDRMGVFWPRKKSENDLEDVLEIELRPAQRFTASVSDHEGAALSGVEVGAVAEYACVSSALTDAEGKATLRLPSDVTPHFFYAWNSDLGFDYRTGDAPNKTENGSNWLESRDVRLRLANVRPVKVRLVDHQDAPIVGAPVQPWTLKKPDESRTFNLGYVPHVFRVATNDDGWAEFGGLPNWETALTFWPYAEDFERRRIQFDSRKHTDGAVTAKLYRLVTARGRVTHPDGRPAADIRVLASGEGYGPDSEYKRATTDADGRFEMRLAPEMLYIFGVQDDEWTAPAVDGIVIRQDQTPEELTFRLQPAVRVHGTLRAGPNEEALAAKGVSLMQIGRPLSAFPGVQLAAPPGTSRRGAAPMLARLTTTDDQGRYEFFVGPGQYLLNGPPDTVGQSVQVADQEELAVDLQVIRPETRPLVVTVVAGDPPRPVSGATVTGAYRSTNARGNFKGETDESGRFAGERLLHPMTLLARSADGTLAGIVEAESDRAELTIAIGPTASADGRLIDHETHVPMAERTIQWGRRVYLDGNRGAFLSDWAGGRLTTDREGGFHVEGLVVGQEYSFSLLSDNGHTSYMLRKVFPRDAETSHLGDVSAAPPDPPYVPPTFKELVEKQLTSDKTPVERFQAALEQAKSLRQNVVTVFVDRENPLTEAWFRLRLEDTAVRKAAYAFQLIHVDVKADGADALAERLGATLNKDELPLWIFRDAAGEEMEQGSIPRSAEGGIDKTAVLTTLANDAPEPLDARTLLKDALAEAKAANKRVIVQETATWCGPCHILSHFLERHRTLWEQDYIWVRMDERWNGSDEVMKGIREERGGIPWFVILDGEGKTMATSDGPDGNIGFPSEPAGIEHFMAMLTSTRQRMSDEQIDVLRKDLESKE